MRNVHGHALAVMACLAAAAPTFADDSFRCGSEVVGETRAYRWTYETYGATRVLVFDQDVLKSIK